MLVGFAAIPLVIVYLSLLGLSIYCLVLFIKLAHRGIKALDIYIENNSNKY